MAHSANSSTGVEEVPTTDRGLITRSASIVLRAPESTEEGTSDTGNEPIEVVWTTGATVRRYSWDGPFDEALSMEAGAVRLGRLNAGAPLLNSHNSYDLSRVIGVVVDGSVTMNATEGRALVRLSEEPEDAVVVNKIRSGLIRHISVGYQVHKWAPVVEREGQPPLVRAIDWEPVELSAVAIPADAGAGFRSMPGRPEAPPTRQEQDLDKQETVATAPPVDLDALREESRAQGIEHGARAERERTMTILNSARKLGLDESAYKPLIDDDKLSAADACARLIDQRAALDEKRGDEIASQVSTFEVGQREHEKRAAAMTSALLHRSRPDLYQLEGGAEDFRSYSLLEMARADLTARGIDTRGWNKTRLAEEGLRKRGAYHTTSDFTGVISDTCNKSLEAGYGEIEQTYKAWARRSTAKDFRPKTMAKLGSAPNLGKVNEHGEYTRGTISDSAETYRIEKYGKIVAVTWEVLVNDDLDAFTRVPGEMGMAAGRLESDVVYNLLKSNPNMADGNAVFSGAHGNIGTAGVPSLTAMTQLRQLLRAQKDGDKFLGLRPFAILAGSDDETAWELLLNQTFTPRNSADAAIPTSFQRLQLITEERLSYDAAGSPITGYYMLSDPRRMPLIEYAYLEGHEGPMTTTREGFDVDGIEIKIRHPFGAGFVEHRAATYNAGA